MEMEFVQNQNSNMQSRHFLNVYHERLIETWLFQLK